MRQRAAVGQFPGRVQPITHIAPTKRGLSWAAWAFLMVMRRISKLTMARELEFIHFARWQRVRAKDLPRLSSVQPEEDLSSDFFVFATNYNGGWDQYIDTFARLPHIRKGMWWLWRFSRGYPGPFPIRTFKDWIHYHTYPEVLYYVAYPHATVRNITAALTVKDRVEGFLEASPAGETAAEFRQRYLAMVREVAPNLGSAPGRSQGATMVRTGAYPVLTEGDGTGDDGLDGDVGGRPATPSAQSFITAMSPIEVKPGYEVTQRILDTIAGLNSGSGPTPFARCPMLHMARILIVEDLRPALGETDAGSLKTNYLLFMADVDGSLDDFLDCLYTADPDFVDCLWGQCLGYPGSGRGPVYFRRYMERCALPVQLPFAAFPGRSALEIRRALGLQGEFLEWMATEHSAGLKDEELKTAFEGWLDRFVAEGQERR